MDTSSHTTGRHRRAGRPELRQGARVRAPHPHSSRHLALAVALVAAQQLLRRTLRSAGYRWQDLRVWLSTPLGGHVELSDDPSVAVDLSAVTVPRWLYGADLCAGGESGDESQGGQDGAHLIGTQVHAEHGDQSEHGLAESDEQGKRAIDGDEPGGDDPAERDHYRSYRARPYVTESQRRQDRDRRGGEHGHGHDRIAPEQRPAELAE